MGTSLPAALLWLGLVAAPAREPAIRDLSVTANGAQILVSFRLEHGFSPELFERIESGLPSGFVYEFELMRDRQHWWDDGLRGSRIEIVAMYNAVTHEFLVNFKHDGKLIDSRTLRDRAELERTMTEFKVLPVFTVERPSAQERYLVRARVEVAPGSVLGFIPVRRTTSWVESNKVRVRD